MINNKIRVEQENISFESEKLEIQLISLRKASELTRGYPGPSAESYVAGNWKKPE